MSNIFNKSNFRDAFISTVISVFVSFGLVLIFALFVKWFCLQSNGIIIGNTIIKIISIFLGIFFGLKNYENGLIKGLFVGLFYSVLSSITFSLYAGETLFYGFNVWDILFGVICGIISGIIVVNVRK